jgi:type I restriction enzyme, S subunit
LSSFDARIELAGGMNKTLEAMGSVLYRQWFVDFNFPNADGTSYKSSGGKVIDSKFGTVPETWEVKNLGSVAESKRGFSYNGREKSNSNGEFVFITLNNILHDGGFKPNYSWITSSRLRERHFLSEFELVIANTHFGVGGSNTGRLLGCPAIVFFPEPYEKAKAVFSHHITRIAPFDPAMKYFLYFFLKATHEETASLYRTGTSVAGLDIDNFMKNKLVPTPPPYLLQKFNSIIGPVFRKIALNHRQGVILAKVRDSILPKLLTGKVRIPTEAR